MTKIDFDGIVSNGGAELADGYAGMNWDNFSVISPLPTYSPISGYAQSIRSGDSVGLNGVGSPAEMQTAGNDFNFIRGYFGAAWNDGLTISVRAYDDGVLVGMKTFTVDYGDSHRVKFGDNFKSIDALVIDSWGGTDHGGDTGAGEQATFEDFLVKFRGAPGAHDREHIQGHVHEHHLNHFDQMHDLMAG